MKKCENCEHWKSNQGGSIHGQCHLNSQTIPKLGHSVCGKFKWKTLERAKNLLANKFDCYHTHDYSVIEMNGEEYLNVHNDDTMIPEYEGIVAKIEKIVQLLNEAECS